MSAYGISNQGYRRQCTLRKREQGVDRGRADTGVSDEFH